MQALLLTGFAYMIFYYNLQRNDLLNQFNPFKVADMRNGNLPLSMQQKKNFIASADHNEEKSIIIFEEKLQSRTKNKS